jgi:transposase
MSENYLGIDVHKNWCVFAEIDSKGKLLRRGRFRNDFGEVTQFAGSLSPRVHLVLEPVLNYLWLLDHLEPFAGSVHVATPFKVRVIAESKCKSDRYDARMLAELLRTNFLPESWVPPYEIRVLRSLTRQRQHLVKMVVMNKNRIRHLLFSHGIRLRVFDIASPKGRAAMKAVSLPDVTRQGIDQCLRMIQVLESSIAGLNQRIVDEIRGNPTTELLQTIPGIGRIWSATIYAEMGDIGRFASAKAFASYTGLTPVVRTSGESRWAGGITRLGSKPLRRALVEASIDAIRKSPALNRMYSRIRYRSNFQKARVAVARKLAVIIYAMLKNGEPFRVQPL